jgi:hypothetical protein
VRHTDTELLCFLNADIEVTDGWLAPLLAFLDARPEVGAVSPVLLFHVAYLLVMGIVGLYVVSRRLDKLLLQ